MRKNGLTLLEIIVSVVILALITAGLTNVFVAGKRWVMHSRSRMTGGELGKTFLDPLQNQVRQDMWKDTPTESTLCVQNQVNCSSSPVNISNIVYTPGYTVTPNIADPAAPTQTTTLNRVKVKLSWQEPTS